MKYIVHIGSEKKEFPYTLQGIQDAFDHAVLRSSGNGIATVAKKEGKTEKPFAQFSNGERTGSAPPGYFPKKGGKKK